MRQDLVSNNAASEITEISEDLNFMSQNKKSTIPRIRAQPARVTSCTMYTVGTNSFASVKESSSTLTRNLPKL